MSKSVSFSSNIRFVNGADYAKLLAKSSADRIGYLHNEVNLLKSPHFFSTEIRTCTGGGLVTQELEAEGFHLLDDMPNMKAAHDILVKLFRYVKNPERGLLVGSKDVKDRPYSCKQFKNLKEAFQKRGVLLSFFEKHLYRKSETAFHYSLNDDTWTLCTGFSRPIENKWNYVSNPVDLRSCFEKVKIADGDRLFIGAKEITPGSYPEFFK